MVFIFISGTKMLLCICCDFSPLFGVLYVLIPCGMEFSRDFTFGFWIFRVSQKQIFASLDFRLYSYLKVTKTGTHMIVFVTFFVTNKFSNLNKRCKFFGAGVCFHGI